MNEIKNEFLSYDYIHNILDDKEFAFCEKSFYHYTSGKAMFNILFEKDYISFRLSSSKHMNDIQEGRNVYHIIREILDEEYSNKSEFHDYLYNVTAKEDMVIHYPTPIGESKHTPSDYYDNYETFLLCFSENNDSLPLWNYYSNRENGNDYGYCLKFDKYKMDELIENDCNRYSDIEYKMVKVIYRDEEKKQLIRKILSDACSLYDNNEDFLESYRLHLHLLEMIFKHQAFEIENEIRVIIKIRTKNGLISEHIKYEYSDGLFKPYFYLKIKRKDILKDIKLSPKTSNSQFIKIYLNDMKNMLLSNCYSNVSLSSSKIPFR